LNEDVKGRIICLREGIDQLRTSQYALYRERTGLDKVLPSDALYPTCGESALIVVTSRMLNEESKCGVFKTSRRCRCCMK
jgi:hypothetical protein